MTLDPHNFKKAPVNSRPDPSAMAQTILDMPYGTNKFGEAVLSVGRDAQELQSQGKAAASFIADSVNDGLRKVVNALLVLSRKKPMLAHRQALREAPGIIGKEKHLREEIIRGPLSGSNDDNRHKEIADLTAIQSALIDLNKALFASREKGK